MTAAEAWEKALQEPIDEGAIAVLEQWGREQREAVAKRAIHAEMRVGRQRRRRRWALHEVYRLRAKVQQQREATVDEMADTMAGCPFCGGVDAHSVSCPKAP